MTQEKGLVVVTGASSGIGKSVAKRLFENGYEVVVTSRNQGKLEELYASHEKYHIVPCDLSNINGIADYCKQVNSALGKITGLVHCAGIGRGNALNMIRPKTIENIFSVNTFAAMLLVSYFSKRNMVEKNASFVLISSVAAHAGPKGQSIYSASKGALEGFVKGSASELALKGIRINAIAPGIVRTELMDQIYGKLEDEAIHRLHNAYPLGIGMPEDVAGFTEYLIDDGSRWITGQTFILDGGYMEREP